MRYRAEYRGECLDHSTDLTKVQVMESGKDKHRLPVKALSRNVDDLCIKKASLYGAKVKYLQSIGQSVWNVIIYYFLNLISTASGRHKSRLTG